MDILTKHSTANNPVLKIVVGILFILFPIIAFILGLQFQALNNQTVNEIVVSPAPTKYEVSTTSPTPVTVDETANWKTYKNKEVGIEFKYPTSYNVHIISNDKFSIVLSKASDFKIKAETDAPIFGITMSLTGCYKPEITQTYPCEKTPEDAINGLKLRGFLNLKTIIETDILVSKRKGKQASGVISDNDGNQGMKGAYYKATYFSNNSTKDGEYLFMISLMEQVKENYNIYDQILSTFKFTQ